MSGCLPSYQRKKLFGDNIRQINMWADGSTSLCKFIPLSSLTLPPYTRYTYIVPEFGCLSDVLPIRHVLSGLIKKLNAQHVKGHEPRAMSITIMWSSLVDRSIK